MKETKLISMTDFVLEQVKLLKTQENNILQFRNNITNYANFLKQPLKLEMFVPCDEYGNFLKFDYPQNKAFCEIAQAYFEKQYREAKEKVLFEGFKICNRNKRKDCIVFDDEHILIKWLENKKIEYLVQYNLTLTENAIKQLGL